MPATPPIRDALQVLRVIADTDPATAPQRAVRAAYLDSRELQDLLGLDPDQAQEIIGALERGLPYSDHDGEYEHTYLIPARAITAAPPPSPATTVSELPAELGEESRQKRLTHLAHAVAHGTGGVCAPNEIYHEPTKAVLKGTRPPGRYLCVTAEGAHQDNPDYVVVETLEAARERFDRELNSDCGPWLPLALVDLEDATDLTDQVTLRVEIPSERPAPVLVR
jgi:hypothetical protein